VPPPTAGTTTRPGATRFAATALRPTAAGSAPCRKRWSRSTAHGPGPNSNTFVQAALDAVPELRAVLPPTAIGKDFPYSGRWAGVTASGTGLYASLSGYLGMTIGWVEGVEINFLGAVLGLDVRRPAVKLPGIGRLGIAAGA
jgi:hypothetical protein